MKRVVLAGLGGALLAGFGLAQTQAKPAMLTLADSERAFARLAGEKGIGPAFFEYFGEEGIAFFPHPEKLRENYRKRPSPPQDAPRPPVLLEWWPVYGDVAAAGDLGYTTGPSVFSDLSEQKRPPRYGFYFSVWKKQADGTWRVQVDMGTEVPAKSRGELAPPTEFHQARYFPVLVKIAPVSDAAGAREEIFKLEKEFGAKGARNGIAAAYHSFLLPEFRVHRKGVFPMTEESKLKEFFRARKISLAAWEPMEGGVASGNDLAYTYGRYELKQEASGAATTEKGYYTRVWKRSARGEWKVVADVTNALPPEAK